MTAYAGLIVAYVLVAAIVATAYAMRYQGEERQ